MHITRGSSRASSPARVIITSSTPAARASMTSLSPAPAVAGVNMASSAQLIPSRANSNSSVVLSSRKQSNASVIAPASKNNSFEVKKKYMLSHHLKSGGRNIFMRVSPKGILAAVSLSNGVLFLLSLIIRFPRSVMMLLVLFCFLFFVLFLFLFFLFCFFFFVFWEMCPYFERKSHFIFHPTS